MILRIPKGQLLATILVDSKEEIRDKIDIVDYIGQVVKLKPAGRTFKGLCPFHNEKSPSFTVSPDRQTFKCFGCGEGGDIFSFYMKREGVTFPEAIKDLAGYAGVELTDYQPPKDLEVKQHLYDINHSAAKLYQFLLTQHKIGQKALDYLKNRGLSMTIINDFQLGYAPDSWHTISDLLVQKKHFKPEDIAASGLTIKSPKGNYYDRFRGRIMFPLQDARGNIVGFSGRVLPWTEDDKSGKYINTPETPIYHKSKLLYPLYHVRDAVRKANKIVIVEGEFDALSSIRVGTRYTVAVKGSSLTTQQVNLIKRYTNTIILALDADAAGVKAAKRAIAVAQSIDIQIKVIHIPQGKDPDELIRTDYKQWKALISAAMSVYDFFIQMATTTNNPATLDGKKAITDEIIPILNQITNKVIQDHFVTKLAQILKTQPDIIAKEMHRRQKANQIGRRGIDEQSEETPKDIPLNQLLMQELLTLILNNYTQIDYPQIPMDDLPDLAIKKILLRIIEDQPTDLGIFAKSLPPELQDSFDHSYLQESDPLTPEQLTHKLNNLISQLAKQHLRDKLSKLRTQLNTSSTQDLRQEINQILTKLRKYS